MEKNIEEKIGEALEERFGTLEIHGGAVLYYQGSQVSQAMTSVAKRGVLN
jgi:hypothetical protein